MGFLKFYIFLAIVLLISPKSRSLAGYFIGFFLKEQMASGRRESESEQNRKATTNNTQYIDK